LTTLVKAYHSSMPPKSADNVMSATKNGGWSSVAPVHNRYGAPKPRTVNRTKSLSESAHSRDGSIGQGSNHDTRIRNKPRRKPPTRCKSEPIPRTLKQKLRAPDKAKWDTQELGKEENGPGMSSGKIKTIGASAQQGPWEKKQNKALWAEKEDTHTESLTKENPFIGISNRPKV